MLLQGVSGSQAHSLGNFFSQGFLLAFSHCSQVAFTAAPNKKLQKVTIYLTGTIRWLLWAPEQQKQILKEMQAGVFPVDRRLTKDGYTLSYSYIYFTLFFF